GLVWGLVRAAHGWFGLGLGLKRGMGRVRRAHRGCSRFLPGGRLNTCGHIRASRLGQALFAGCARRIVWIVLARICPILDIIILINISYLMIYEKLKARLPRFWSSTDFDSEDLSLYAEQFMVSEVSRGVGTLGLVTLLLLIGASVLYELLNYNSLYLYTCLVLSLLCVHVIFTSRRVMDAQALHLLCMTLIIVSGTAFVLLAHHEGNFNNALLPSVVVLFMVIPIVPWGMREGMAVVLLIYLVFTLSTLSVTGRFSSDNLLILQFMMLVSAMVSLTILGRNVAIRKDDIKARYELERAHRTMERLSYEDGLTGAWNRRYLEVQFKRVMRRMLERSSNKIYFGLIDVDDFKQINDSLGHHVGDEVLKKIAAGFQQALGESSYVFRIGGDEFVIVFEGRDYESLLQTAAQGLCEPSTGIPQVKVSIGVIEVEGLSDDIDLDKLYKEADKSLYRAKTRKHTQTQCLNCVASKLMGV
ncbi:MAG: GGDEF domain-containing protein, partial [Gammaproteobacteria bacterium]